MDLYRTIHYMLPDIRDNQFMLQDNSDGNGPFIAQWTYPAPQPTKEELETAWAEIDDVDVVETVPLTTEQKLEIETQINRDQSAMLDMLAEMVYA
jgi:hypothetical protein